MLTKNSKYTVLSKYISQSHKDELISSLAEDDLKGMNNLSIGFSKLRLLTTNRSVLTINFINKKIKQKKAILTIHPI